MQLPFPFENACTFKWLGTSYVAPLFSLFHSTATFVFTNCYNQWGLFSLPWCISVIDCSSTLHLYSQSPFVATASYFFLIPDIDFSIFSILSTSPFSAIYFPHRYHSTRFHHFIQQRRLPLPFPTSFWSTQQRSLTMTTFSLSIRPCPRMWPKTYPSGLLTSVSATTRRFSSRSSSSPLPGFCERYRKELSNSVHMQGSNQSFGKMFSFFVLSAQWVQPQMVWWQQTVEPLWMMPSV